MKCHHEGVVNDEMIAQLLSQPILFNVQAALAALQQRITVNTCNLSGHR